VPGTQGNSTYSPRLRKHQNIEEFLTTKANKAHKGKDFTENLVPGAFALPGTPAALTLLAPA
jgi:hypothetical protein